MIKSQSQKSPFSSPLGLRKMPGSHSEERSERTSKTTLFPRELQGHETLHWPELQQHFKFDSYHLKKHFSPGFCKSFLYNYTESCLDRATMVYSPGLGMEEVNKNRIPVMNGRESQHSNRGIRWQRTRSGLRHGFRSQVFLLLIPYMLKNK